MPRFPSKFAGLILLGLCVACAGRPVPLAKAPSWAQTDGVRYVCANQKTFIVSFSPSGDKAAFKLGDDLYEAHRAVSGSGVRYESDDLLFIGKGRIGQLTKSPDGAYPDCKAID